MKKSEHTALKRICKGRFIKGQLNTDGQVLDEIYEYLKTVKIEED